MTRAARCSVLLRVRNALPTLDACIASIQNQTEQAYEVIAIDDGLTARYRRHTQ
ncbi:MAG: glycosyltransferase family A protein [Gammaproteobacteria bacterium]